MISLDLSLVDSLILETT
jgi:hypothetical protein